MVDSIGIEYKPPPYLLIKLFDISYFAHIYFIILNMICWYYCLNLISCTLSFSFFITFILIIIQTKQVNNNNEWSMKQYLISNNLWIEWNPHNDWLLLLFFSVIFLCMGAMCAYSFWSIYNLQFAFWRINHFHKSSSFFFFKFN